LVSVDGTVLRVARRPTPLRRMGDATELDADELVATAVAVVRECVDGVDDLAGVGVASMAESGVPLDAAGRPLAPIIGWSDRRSAEDAEAIAASVGVASLYATTGLRPDAKYSLPKIRWLQRHRPARMRRMGAWAGVAELLALRLTGVLGTDASLACRTLAFDLRRRGWDAELLALAGVAAEQMPRVVSAGTAVGQVTDAGAALSGLPRGVPVAVAGHDHLVGAFGAGIGAPGHIADSMGTAEVAILLLDEPRLSNRAFDAGLTAGIAAGSGRPYLLGNLPTSGALLEWFRSSLLAGGEIPPPSRIPSALSGTPFLGGRGAPDPAPAATASIAGLRTHYGLGDMALALVEGAAYQLRSIVETLEQIAGERVADVTLFGGGARNGTWAGTKANVNPWPTQLAGSTEATAVGAAMIGAIAAGHPVPRVAPATRLARDDRLAATYDELYRDRFRPLASASWWPSVDDR
jgi:xylulokinase